MSDAVHLLGIPFDGAASARKGAASAPDAIRRAFENIETYSPYLDKDWSEYRIVDLGNFSLERFLKMAKKLDLKHNNIKFITMGGDHSVSLAPISIYLDQYPGLAVVHLDAHADLRLEYDGNPCSHACIMRRVVEKFSKKNRLIQYGIRSGTREEFAWIREKKTMPKDLRGLRHAVDELDSRLPIYLTLDLDFFDPAFLPGTGTPEAGGENFQSFMGLLHLLDGKNFVGADIVELAPGIDGTGNSSFMAAKVMREIMLAMCRPRNKR